MRSLLRLLGVLVLLAAWAALVVLAVRSGRAEDWGVTGVYAAGAAVALFLALVSFSRFRAVRRGDAPVRRAPTHRG